MKKTFWNQLTFKAKADVEDQPPKRATKRKAGSVASQSKVPDEVAPKKRKADGKKNTVQNFGINPPEHICDICKKSLATAKNLRLHISSVHEKKKPFKCNDCEKSFSQKCALKKHTETVHEAKREFDCQNCKKKLSAKQHLENHISIVHEKIKPFSCDTCNRKFGTKLELQRHNNFYHQA